MVSAKIILLVSRVFEVRYHSYHNEVAFLLFHPLELGDINGRSVLEGLVLLPGGFEEFVGLVDSEREGHPDGPKDHRFPRIVH